MNDHVNERSDIKRRLSVKRKDASAPKVKSGSVCVSANMLTRAMVRTRNAQLHPSISNEKSRSKQPKQLILRTSRISTQSFAISNPSSLCLRIQTAALSRDLPTVPSQIWATSKRHLRPPRLSVGIRLPLPNTPAAPQTRKATPLDQVTPTAPSPYKIHPKRKMFRQR